MTWVHLGWLGAGVVMGTVIGAVLVYRIGLWLLRDAGPRW